MIKNSIQCKSCGNTRWQVLNNIAECTNCSHTRPFYPRNKQIGVMTNTQIKTIANLKAALLFKHATGSFESEIKECREEMIEHTKIASFSIVIGYKGDEGNLLILSREYRHIFIGPRGAVSLVNARSPKTGKYLAKQKGWSKAIYGWVRGKVE